MPLCFLHGLDSSPQGTKARLIRENHPECWIPELPPDVFERVEIVERGVKTPMLFVGSSLGGLTAILFAMRCPSMVKGMVLMAPAVGSSDRSILAGAAGLLESLYIPCSIPSVIVAGIRDELIPVSAIRSLVQRSPDPNNIRLHEVDDDHMLHQSLSLMLKSIEQIGKSAARIDR